MKKAFQILALTVLSIIFIENCGNTDSKSANLKQKTTLDSPKQNAADTFKVKGINNDIAKFSAGIKVSKKSEIYTFTENTEWTNFYKRSDSCWNYFYKKNGDKVKSWAESELKSTTSTYKTLFYPFSGPDFLFADLIFPNVDKYIMLAREGVGRPIDLKDVKNEMPKLLATIDTATNDILFLTYFRTKDMAYEINNAHIKGALPIIMLFCARTDNTILDIKPVSVNAAGKIEYLNEFKDYTAGDKINKGAEIKIKNNITLAEKTIVYLCEDISDEGIKGNTHLKKYLDNLQDNSVTYIKSASFLMRKPNFTQIRKTIMAKSSVILQDDSGIPINMFEKSKWNTTLYGQYNGPFYLFKAYKMEDLKKMYKEDHPKTLDFNIGYNDVTNMQLFVKK